ncbi:hypothetical protein GJ744_005584 [Endocarpon pusillum]|uniref:Arrestin-like N-terminal domain-containing protein n=1 Tax=Endocarpon pusillum TaxID=364733 RepID=A0A8H7AL39_9EURO|nr:hypothetical protein GJ744_005584 [Endocarpon pusillum]
MSRGMLPGRRRSAALQSFSFRKPSDVDIILDDEDEHSFVSSYTNLDKISGHILIKCGKDTSFHELEISFEGVTETYIEKVATTAPTSGRTIGRHRFLKLLQPIDPSLLPENRVARAGVLYTFPFEFVVPDRLLDQQCTHRVDSPQVHEAHTRVPPSFGDPMLAGDGLTLQDDMAPEMSKIQYMIRARMVKARATGTRSSDVADKAIKVRIVPAVDEDPPLNITEDNKDFELRKEKDVRKGLFKGKLGRITAEAPQPSGFRLPALKNQSGCPISTMTTVNLRFDPIDDKVQPPPLGSIVSKLRAQTFFGSVPFRHFPSRSSVNAWDTQRGFFVQSVELSSRCISSVEWRKHDGMGSSTASLSRRQSDFSELSMASTENTPDPSSAYRPGSPFYTAKVLVPMVLPRNRSFTPTFHSCSVSRTYVLDLNVSYHTPGATVSTPSIQLRLPIQISAEGNPDATLTISEEEARAIATREVDEELAEGRFSSRSLAPNMQIPEYSETQPRLLPAFQGLRRHSEQQQGPPVYSRAGWGGSLLRGGVATMSESLSAFQTAARATSVSVM